jgi:hypothetical protein
VSASDEPYDDSFLRHAVANPSQYDATARALAQMLLNLRELCAAHGQLVLCNEARRSEKLPDAIKRLVRERDDAVLLAKEAEGRATPLSAAGDAMRDALSDALSGGAAVHMDRGAARTTAIAWDDARAREDAGVTCPRCFRMPGGAVGEYEPYCDLCDRGCVSGSGT